MPADSPSAAAPPPDRSAVTVFHRSFPLVALLQLATFCAALTACTDGARLGEIIDDLPGWTAEAWEMVVAAIFSGGLLGFIIGLGQLKMWRSSFKCSVVGALCGVAILSVYIAPAPIERAAAAAVVLLLSSVVFRLRAP